MAEDLTPPASGGVEPDPDQVLFAGPALVEHVAVKQRSYVVRFAVGYGLLGIVAGFAIAAFLLALGVSRPDPEPAWSGFVPQATVDRSAASVIADYVGGAYRLQDGSQLVAVSASLPTFQGVPVAAIAVQAPQGSVQQDVRVIDAKKAIAYVLCGLGKKCAIASGKPSVERDRLLRRESLELALYTFRYVEGVDTVLAYLPPKKGSNPDLTMLYERADFQAQLAVPLGRTLSDRVPGVDSMPIGEQAAIDRLTARWRYAFAVQQLQDGSPVIVLNNVSGA